MALHLINMLARIHRHVTISVPSKIKLKAESISGGGTLDEAILNTAVAIDPFGQFELGKIPKATQLSIGIGKNPSSECDLYLGADGFIGCLDTVPLKITDSNSGTAFGAGIAACLGAAAMFRKALKLPVSARRVSLWNYKESTDASTGLSEIPQLNLGKVLMVGAGAVASSLVYWLKFLNVSGDWVIVDKDIVKLHNTNRGLLFFPYHTDWENGNPISKADLLSNNLDNSSAIIEWFSDIKDFNPVEFDVVLALANEHNVRTELASQNYPVILHATTNTEWTSILHRHIPAFDDCLECRTSEFKELEFGCSEGILPKVENKSKDESTDASLPFLSATSGLLLASALLKLQTGTLIDDPKNEWRFHFMSDYKFITAGKRSCRAGCGIKWQEHIREKVFGHTKWFHLNKEIRN